MFCVGISASYVVLCVSMLSCLCVGMLVCLPVGMLASLDVCSSRLFNQPPWSYHHFVCKVSVLCFVCQHRNISVHVALSVLHADGGGMCSALSFAVPCFHDVHNGSSKVPCSPAPHTRRILRSETVMPALALPMAAASSVPC